MENLRIKKHKENYEVGVFFGKSSKSSYSNIIDKDPNKIAQILIDLIIQGFPIEKAMDIVRERIGRRDWLGF